MIRLHMVMPPHATQKEPELVQSDVLTDVG